MSLEAYLTMLSSSVQFVSFLIFMVCALIYERETLFILCAICAGANAIAVSQVVAGPFTLPTVFVFLNVATSGIHLLCLYRMDSMVASMARAQKQKRQPLLN